VNIIFINDYILIVKYIVLYLWLAQTLSGLNFYGGEYV